MLIILRNSDWDLIYLLNYVLCTLHWAAFLFCHSSEKCPQSLCKFLSCCSLQNMYFWVRVKGRWSIKGSGSMIELLRYFCVSGSLARQNFPAQGSFTQIRTGHIGQQQNIFCPSANKVLTGDSSLLGYLCRVHQ